MYDGFSLGRDLIQLDPLIDRASYQLITGGPYAAIEPVTGTDDRVAQALLGYVIGVLAGSTKIVLFSFCILV